MSVEDMDLPEEDINQDELQAESEEVAKVAPGKFDKLLATKLQYKGIDRQMFL